jgi:hypothetical protein
MFCPLAIASLAYLGREEKTVIEIAKIVPFPASGACTVGIDFRLSH